MKYLLYILTVLSLFSSCETSEDVTHDIEILRKHRLELRQERYRLKQDITSNQIVINRQEQRLREQNILGTSRQPVYLLKIRLKQDRLIPDLEDYFKDEMNAVEFELPVSKEFYEQVKEGEQIVDEFRVGSLILHGTFSSWNMTIIDKSIH